MQINVSERIEKMRSRSAPQVVALAFGNKTAKTKPLR